MYNHIYACVYNDPADSVDQEMRVTSVQGSLDHEKKEQFAQCFLAQFHECSLDPGWILKKFPKDKRKLSTSASYQVSQSEGLYRDWAERNR